MPESGREPGTPEPHVTDLIHRELLFIYLEMLTETENCEKVGMGADWENDCPE